MNIIGWGWELGLYCDLGKPLRGKEDFHLPMDVCEDLLILVQDMSSQNQCPRGEGPDVELMNS